MNHKQILTTYMLKFTSILTQSPGNTLRFLDNFVQ